MFRMFIKSCQKEASKKLKIVNPTARCLREDRSPGIKQIFNYSYNLGEVEYYSIS